MKARRKKDLKEIIDIVMHSPLTEQQLTDLDGTIPMSQLRGLNLDVQTAITVRIANQAVGGDIKSAEWLGKYGGLEPIREQKVTLDLPILYSNMDELPEDVKAALAAETAIAINQSTDEDSEGYEIVLEDSDGSEHTD